MCKSFEFISSQVQKSIESYEPSGEHQGIGSALPLTWFVNEFDALKKAVIKPYLARMRDDVGSGIVVLDVVVVADDDDDALVIYDLLNDVFVLANRDIDGDRVRAIDIVSCGVRGDLVDCFMSR